MSKIGEKPVAIEEGITVEVNGQTVKINGKEGSMEINLPKSLGAEMKDGTVKISRKREDKKTRSEHGLLRSLVSNAVKGVAKSWERNLEVVGTGYNVKMTGEDLELKVGYSHPVVFKAVPGIKYRVEGNNKITVAGADKQLVGQIAFQIKKVRIPDVYKGKGIKFEGEKLRIKPGKKAKTATGAA